MATTIYHGEDGAITQVANAWVFDPTAPVLLKAKGEPGVAPHANTSKSIWNSLASIWERGTEMANRYSAMNVGKHALVVLVGRPTMVRDHPNGFLSWAKDVWHEGGEMVHHGVETAVNSIMQSLAPEVVNAGRNAAEVFKGMTADDFKDAAQETIDALMEMLKDPQTYVGLGISLGALAVQGVPVVGQVVGGAVLADRIYSLGVAGEQAIAELKDIMSTWTQGPLTPEQLAEARKRLAAWILGAGAVVIGALVKKTIKIVRNKRSEKINDDNKAVQSDKKNSEKGPCACALGGPVLIVTGEKLLDETDFELPGPIPIIWRRRYRSGDLEVSPWGAGWAHPLWIDLRISASGVTFRDEQGRSVQLPLLSVGDSHFELSEGLTLHRHDSTRWEIEFKSGLSLHFGGESASSWRLPLQSMSDRNGNKVLLEWKHQDKESTSNDFAPQRLMSITDAVGRQLRLQWNQQNLDSVHLKAPGVAEHELVRYEFDAQKQLIASFHAGHVWRQYAWRGGVLVGYRKATGARFFADYDDEGPHGRVTRSWCADTGEGHAFRYDFRESTTWATDALGRTTGYRFNQGFDIVETIAPDGTRSETPMDANHLPLGSVDAMGRKTSNRFDQRGNLIAHTSADGALTRLTYNDKDLPETITDALGHQWQRHYDIRGNLIASIDPLGRTTHYEYDERGNVITVVDATGKSKHVEWDALGNLRSYIDCSGSITYYRHDALGRLLERTDALNQQTRYEWSATGQLRRVQEADAGEHHYNWDGEGNLLEYTDPLEATTYWHYDAGNRPVVRQDAAGRQLCYRYDAAGRLLELTNENHAVTRFAYDIADNLTDEIGFDNRWQRYVYNAAGELVRLIEAGAGDAGPGKVTHFERDAMGRLQSRHAQAALNMSQCRSEYRYDKLGRLIEANNDSAHLRFAYDPLGNLLSQAQSDPLQAPVLPRAGRPLDPFATGPQQVLRHQYDPLGNRTQTTLPDGRSVHYLYYGSGHLHQIELEHSDGTRQTLTDIERDALHRETLRSQGTLHSQYAWDPMGRLLQHRVQQGARLSQHAPTAIERRYHWDKAGQLTSRTDSHRGLQQFQYDPTGRIQHALGGPLGPEQFAFDPAGNLLDAQPIPTSHAGYSALVVDNRIKIHQDLRYDYDVHGNVTERLKGTYEKARFTWTADHQLQEAEVEHHGVAQTTRYAYDALGRRMRKSGTFGDTHYLWDGDLMIESRRGHHSSLFIYEPQSFVPLATVQGAANDSHIYWYQCDQVGVPQELTNHEGHIVWAADYKAWGEAKIRALGTGTDGPYTSPRQGPRRAWHGGWEGTGDHVAYMRGASGTDKSGRPKATPPPPIEQPFRLQGQHFDEETGLHYNRFRYYDARIGRFVSQDPIGFVGSRNFYRYSKNSITYTDPLGLSDRCLYRGVHAQHPALEDAKKGKVSAANSNAKLTPEQHADGGLTGESQYVSWTPNKEMALEHANKSGPGGVLLEVPVGAPQPGEQWKWGWTHINDWGEVEMLQEGTRTGIKSTIIDCCCPK